jgi:RNA polymerase sigma factor (sigma-70 family)
MYKYQNADLGGLARQLVLSPRHLRRKQIAGVERVMDVLDSGKSYPFDWVRFHITGTKAAKPDERRTVSSDQLLADLPTLAEHITRKAAIPEADLEGAHETLDALSARLEVSTKTIRRWRCRGLIGIRVMCADGVSRLQFSDRAIERFTKNNKDLVARGASFKLLTEAEKQNIIELARAMLIEKRQKLHVIARAVSAETGRAVETIRYTLRQYDAANPDDALFARNGEPVVAKRHLAIWRCRQSGETVEQIAEAFEIDVATVEAVLRELEARQLKSEPIEYVDNELFHAPGAEEIILDGPRPKAPEKNGKRIRAPKGLPAYLRSLYDVPLLSREQEADLFRRFNFLRCLVASAVEKLDVYTVTREELDRIRGWQERADALKNELIQANLRLVVSIAKRHVGRGDNFFEVVSDGNMTLMRAVEKFDFSLGYKFSTYGTWSVMKTYARSIPEGHYRMRRYVTGQDELIDATADAHEAETSPSDLDSVRVALSEGMEQLTDRERTIVKSHFGLFDADGTALTLEDLGKRFGVTKERVRQIEQRAIGKLRSVLSPTLLEAFSQ